MPWRKEAALEEEHFRGWLWLLEAAAAETEKALWKVREVVGAPRGQRLD